MTRTSFSFSEEPKEAVYESLLEVGLTQSARVGLIIQKWRTYPPGALELLDRLAPFLIDVKDTSEWPGTRLATGYVEELRLYRYERPVKQLLLLATDGLFDWQNPELPEDLHLIREDGSVWLGSIAHEADAWLELSHDEHAAFRDIAPDVVTLLRQDQ